MKLTFYDQQVREIRKITLQRHTFEFTQAGSVDRLTGILTSGKPVSDVQSQSPIALKFGFHRDDPQFDPAGSVDNNRPILRR